VEGLDGPRHRKLLRELIGYAVPVLRQLLRDGRIFAKCRRLHRPAPDSDAWLDFTEAEREEFARDMVADGMPVFNRAVFEQRRWSPARGASLRTYLVNACVLQFPALYRRWLDQRRAIRPAGLDVIDPNGDPMPDPAAAVIVRDEVSRVLER